MNRNLVIFLLWILPFGAIVIPGIERDSISGQNVAIILACCVSGVLGIVATAVTSKSVKSHPFQTIIYTSILCGLLLAASTLTLLVLGNLLKLLDSTDHGWVVLGIFIGILHYGAVFTLTSLASNTLCFFLVTPKDRTRRVR